MSKFDPSVYDEQYYQSHCGTPYDREYGDGMWVKFFSAIAQQIVERYAPTKTLDVGCAKGFLVEALVDQGVNAYGFDISNAALRDVRDDVSERITLGSSDDTRSYHGFYSLITCIEVVEHLTQEMGETTISLICQHTDLVIFSSTPDDYEEQTHINVQQPAYWDRIFAKYDFVHDPEEDWVRHFVSPHARIYKHRRRFLGDRLCRLEDRFASVEGTLNTVVSNIRRAQQNTTLTRLESRVDSLQESLTAIYTAVSDSNGILERLELISVLSRRVDELSHRLEASLQNVEEMDNQLSQKTLTVEELHADLDTTKAHADALSKEIASLRSDNALLSDHIDAMERTRGWIVLEKLRRVRNRGKDYLRLIRKVVRYSRDRGMKQTVARVKEKVSHVNEDKIYHEHVMQSLLSHREKSRIRSEIGGWKYRPTVSVVVPVYNVPVIWLRRCIQSVMNQVYPYWELCLYDDCSSSSETLEVLHSFKGWDQRIKVEFGQQNLGIVGATNKAISLASGEFIAFLDNDDELTEDALFHVCSSLQTEAYDYIYSDEDKLTTDGIYMEPHYKPDWSPDLYLSGNYTSHFSVYRKSIGDEVGWLREGMDGSQDYDFTLRFTEKTDKIHHVSKVLYHWRKIPGSTADDAYAKPYAYESGKKALEDAVTRRGIVAEVNIVCPGHYRVTRKLPAPPKIVVFLSVYDYDRALAAYHILQKTDGLSEIHLINSGQLTRKLCEKLKSTLHPVGIVSAALDCALPDTQSFFAALQSYDDNDLLLFIDDQFTEGNPEWVGKLAEHAVREDVCAVGGKILNKRREIVSAGVLVNGKTYSYSHSGSDANAFGYFGYLVDVRNVAAVAPECFMTSLQAFRRINGFRNFSSAAQAVVDYSLRGLQLGLVNVFTPDSSVVISQTSAETGKGMLSTSFITHGYYNPNLNTSELNFRLGLGDSVGIVG